MVERSAASTATMRRGLVGYAALLAVALGRSAAEAIVVRYEVVPLGGQTYQYVYTNENDGGLGAGTQVGLFGVSFDPALYQEPSLARTTPQPLASGWNEMFLASAPGVPAAYDALALAGGVTNGSAVSGFSVRFTWLGTEPPGDQPFTIYDPLTFVVLEQGLTVPAPPTPWALMTGATVLLVRFRRRSGRALR